MKLKEIVEYQLKHHVALLRFVNLTVSSALRLLGKFVPMDNKMVLFSSLGRKYNDSPKAIYEYMMSLLPFKDYKMVWALDDPENTSIPGTPIKIKSDTITYFKYALKAKYWITSVNIERSLHFKKKDCVYLNTWHGTALNKMGNEWPGRNDFDFSHINFFCYESEYQKQHCFAAFKTREEAMIPTGLPRNDSLYRVTQEEVMEIKKRLNLPLDKKIILYAPTWRDSNDHGENYVLQPPIHIDYWEDRLKEDYIILFRTHHYTTKLLGVTFNSFVRNYIDYPVVNDLFKVSDILISDYSSCITDFSILERPIICFGYDYDEYRAYPGLNIDFDKELPSGVLRTEEEVVNHIMKMDYEKECLKTKEFKNKYTNIGGHATEICVEKMFGIK